MDESDYGLLYNIKESVAAQEKILTEISTTLKQLVSTLECFGDFKP